MSLCINLYVCMYVCTCNWNWLPTIFCSLHRPKQIFKQKGSEVQRAAMTQSRPRSWTKCAILLQPSTRWRTVGNGRAEHWPSIYICKAPAVHGEIEPRMDGPVEVMEEIGRNDDEYCQRREDCEEEKTNTKSMIIIMRMIQEEEEEKKKKKKKKRRRRREEKEKEKKKRGGEEEERRRRRREENGEKREEEEEEEERRRRGGGERGKRNRKRNGEEKIKEIDEEWNN